MVPYHSVFYLLYKIIRILIENKSKQDFSSVTYRDGAKWSLSLLEMSMAALPLPRRTHSGGSGAAVNLHYRRGAARQRQFIFYYRRGAAVADVQPRWTSLVPARPGPKNGWSRSCLVTYLEFCRCCGGWASLSIWVYLHPEMTSSPQGYAAYLASSPNFGICNSTPRFRKLFFWVLFK